MMEQLYCTLPNNVSVDGQERGLGLNAIRIETLTMCGGIIAVNHGVSLPSHTKLTKAETNLVSLIGIGMRGPEIREAMYIDPEKMHQYRGTIHDKLTKNQEAIIRDPLFVSKAFQLGIFTVNKSVKPQYKEDEIPQIGDILFEASQGAPQQKMASSLRISEGSVRNRISKFREASDTPTMAGAITYGHLIGLL